jgi:hypothetical protein
MARPKTVQDERGIVCGKTTRLAVWRPSFAQPKLSLRLQAQALPCARTLKLLDPFITLSVYCRLVDGLEVVGLQYRRTATHSDALRERQTCREARAQNYGPPSGGSRIAEQRRPYFGSSAQEKGRGASCFTARSSGVGRQENSWVTNRDASSEP